MPRPTGDRNAAVFRDAGMVLNLHDEESLERLRDSTFQRQRRRRRLSVVAMIGMVAIVLVALHTASSAPQEEMLQIKDPYFYEPETEIRSPRTMPRPEYVSHSASCPTYDDQAPPSWNSTTVSWMQRGQELTTFIQDRFRANLDHANKYTNNFGYGSNVALSADGKRIAAAFEGKAGFDGTFGTHVEVHSYNGTQWVLEQVLADVKRGHGQSHIVHFQSLAMSSNGQRLAFSDGHGVVVFEYNRDKAETPWESIVPILGPDEDEDINLRNADSHAHRFGMKLAMNCDGSIVAVNGNADHYSYTKVYELEAHEGTKWIEIGEVRNIQFGGSIALSNSGTRLAIGTVASEAWRGMVQVFENKGGIWWRIGQPILGAQPLDNWGGSVSLTDDGNIIAVSSKNGFANRVTVYESRPNQENEELMSWQQIGPDLHGRGSRFEHFGYDIDLNHDGTILAVSAPGDHELAEQMKSGTILSGKDPPFVRGEIHMYRFENNDWIKFDDENNLMSTADGDMFGSSIALSGDGLTVIGGAPKREGKVYQHMLGGVHVYTAVLGE